MTSNEHEQPDRATTAPDPENARDTRSKKGSNEGDDGRVDEWGEESFPASDPPSQSPGEEH